MNSVYCAVHVMPWKVCCRPWHADDPALGMTIGAFNQRYGTGLAHSLNCICFHSVVLTNPGSNWEETSPPFPIDTPLCSRNTASHTHTVVSDVATTASFIFHISNYGYFLKLRFFSPSGECTSSGVLVEIPSTGGSSCCWWRFPEVS